MKKEEKICNKCINCPKEEIVHQLLEVQAQITVTPFVEHGEPKICCIESDIKRERDCDSIFDACKKRNKCTFTLRQVICVEIPFTIGADVDVDQGISKCCRPELGPCDNLHKNTSEM